MRLLKVSPWLRCVLVSACVSGVIPGPFPGPFQHRAVAEEDVLQAVKRDKAVDKEHMLQVWKALMAYIADKGMTPDHLSELVPDYLADKNVLLSPTAAQVGTEAGNNGFEDPKLPCSYCYEFSGRKFFDSALTFRELKQAQMQEFGGIVPILRCFYYDRVMNVSYSGDFYETELYWEDAPEAKKIIARIGLGPGFKEGEFVSLKIINGQTSTPLTGATVKLTERSFHHLTLPDRVLRSDGDGMVQVPLGTAEAPGRQLKVTVSADGYDEVAEQWTADPPVTERKIVLKRKAP